MPTVPEYNKKNRIQYRIAYEYGKEK